MAMSVVKIIGCDDAWILYSNARYTVGMSAVPVAAGRFNGGGSSAKVLERPAKAKDVDADNVESMARSIIWHLY